MSSSAVVVDLEVDFHNEDETGYVWTWLSEARDPSMIAPERIVVVGDDDAIAMARVVDLVEHENGTIVHVEILPGTVAEYFEAVARAAVIPADKWRQLEQTFPATTSNRTGRGVRPSSAGDDLLGMEIDFRVPG